MISSLGITSNTAATRNVIFGKMIIKKKRTIYDFKIYGRNNKIVERIKIKADVFRLGDTVVYTLRAN